MSAAEQDLVQVGDWMQKSSDFKALLGKVERQVHLLIKMDKFHGKIFIR
jgi:hypothetical protein